MLAYIRHFWIGAALALVGLLAVVSVVGAYLKFVTSQRYPGRRARRDD